MSNITPEALNLVKVCSPLDSVHGSVTCFGFVDINAHNRQLLPFTHHEVFSNSLVLPSSKNCPFWDSDSHSLLVCGKRLSLHLTGKLHSSPFAEKLNIVLYFSLLYTSDGWFLIWSILTPILISPWADCQALNVYQESVNWKIVKYIPAEIDRNHVAPTSCYVRKIDRNHGSWPDNGRRDCCFLAKELESKNQHSFGSRFSILNLLPKIRGI